MSYEGVNALNIGPLIIGVFLRPLLCDTDDELPTRQNLRPAPYC